MTGTGTDSNRHAAAPGVKLLTPDERPRRRWPWPAPIVVGAAVLANMVLSRLRGEAVEWISFGATAVAALAVCALASWLEETLYASAAALPGWKRLAAMMAVLPMGFLGLHAAAVVLGVPAMLLGDDWTLGTAFAIGGWWFVLAGVGSLVVVVLDVVVSAIVKDFRSRIVLAVLSLVALSTGLATALAMLGTGALAFIAEKSAKEGQAMGWSIDGNRHEEMLDPANVGPLAAMLACVAGMLALPVLLSSCSKLADAVMERLHPLQRAFSAVAAGNLAVKVEEGGSTDFQKLSIAFNGMVGSLALAQRMDRAYGAYLGKQVSERIRSQHGEATMAATSRVASFFFADIRGFTSMSERLEPAQVLGILNRYFEKVVAIIDANEGYLNKFIGDAVVVVFNAPLDQPDHAERAVRCAIAIQQEVAKLNAANAFPEVGALGVGIGVASGPVVAGNLGSEKQMEYTVIGDTVNLAARLTSKAPAGEVWVNAATAAALPPAMRGVELPPFQVKGKELPVAAHRVWPPAS